MKYYKMITVYHNNIYFCSFKEDRKRGTVAVKQMVSSSYENVSLRTERISLSQLKGMINDGRFIEIDKKEFNLFNKMWTLIDKTNIEIKVVQNIMFSLKSLLSKKFYEFFKTAKKG